MTFASPVKQMIFALKEMANYSEIIESELWPDLDDNFIETLLNEAAKLADNSIAPLNQSADKAGSILNNGNVSTAPGFKEAYKELVNSSWGTLSGLKNYGGQGLPKTIAVMIQELWNTSCMSFSLCPMLTQGAVEAISHHGTENQKKEYLPRLLTGEWSGTMNLTEPHAGSDVGALKTSAKKNSDGSYSIKGTKIYITYGDHDMAENIIHLVLARIEGAPEGNNGISLFIVPKFIKNQETPDYIESLTKEENEINSSIQQNDSNDELFNQAVEVIMKDKRVSTSYIQRKLQIGYNRAARIIEEMEDQGIISEPNNQGKREILGK